MNFTAEQLQFLAASRDFDVALQNDPVLNEIEASRIDYARERLLLFEAVRGTLTICGDIVIRPITPFIWCYLWTLNNPFVCGETCTAQDCAVFVYLLTHAPSDLSYDTIEKDAREYADSIRLLDRLDEFYAELVELVKTTLSPLDMLQKTQGSHEKPVFDVDWLLSVCSIAAQEANISAVRVALELPLSAVFGYMVIRARKAHPGEVYSHHMPEWCSKNYIERVQQLKEQFIKDHFKTEA